MNVTISVDADVLRRARIRALQQGESVNGYLAEALRRYADMGGSTSVFHDLAAIADTHPAGPEGSGRQWTREELHRA